MMIMIVLFWHVYILGFWIAKCSMLEHLCTLDTLES